MDYPLGRGDPRVRRRVEPGHRASSTAHHEYRKHLRPLDGPAFAARLVELLGVYDPDVVAVQLNLLGSHDAPRALTVLGGDLAALRMATLLQCTLPGRAVHLLRRRDRPGRRQRPANRGAFPWDEGALGLRRCAPSSGRPPAARRRAGAAARVDDRDRRPTGRRSRSSAGSMAGGWSSRSMPATESVDLDVTLEGVGGGRLDARRPRRRRRRQLPKRSTSTDGAPGSRSRRAADMVLPSHGPVTPDRPSVGRSPYTSRLVADLPLDLAPGLAEQLARVLDVEGKIPRAIEALGPVGGRDVVLIDGAGGTARSAARPTSARGSRSSNRADRRRSMRPTARPTWSSLAGRRSAAPRSDEMPQAERMLRPGGRLLVVHDYGRDDVAELRGDAAGVRTVEPARRPVPGQRLQDPGRPLLVDVRVDRRGARVPGRRLRRGGRTSVAALTRPRLSYNVAVYHRTLGEEPA